MVQSLNEKGVGELMMTIKIEDNERFTIGSAEDNDLVIYGDESVE